MTHNTREEQAPEEQGLRAERGLGGEAVRTFVAVGALVALYYGLWYGSARSGVVPTAATLEYTHLTKPEVRQECGEPSKDGRLVVVEMLYSDNKKSWIEDAASRYAHVCPHIHVKLKAMGDIESANVILSGHEKPALWSPADELVVRYLEASVKERKSEAVIPIGEQVSIAHSPLVVLTWQDQDRVLDEILPAIDEVDGPWAAIACAQVPRDPDLSHVEREDMLPGRWIDWYNASVPPPPKKKLPTAPQKALKAPPGEVAPVPLGQIESWGRVKFSHASPSRSAAGLETLYLMAYDYTFPPRERAAASAKGAATAVPADPPQAEGKIEGSEHLRDEFQRRFSERKDALQRWLQRCEAGLESSPRSAEQQTAYMYKYGPSRYDFVTAYEHLVFSQLKKSEDNESSMPELRVRYPQPTIVNRHPIVSLLPEGPEHDAVRQASERWIAFLRSDDIQKLAIEYGFRPAIDAVKISDHRVSKNPFLRMQPHGISFDETLTEPPRLDGKAVRELITLWENATGRH